MNQQLATIIYIVGIAGLFFLDREPAWRVSKGLWVPVLWLLIVGSRPVSSWFQSGPTVSLEQSFTDGSPVDAAVFAGRIDVTIFWISPITNTSGPKCYTKTG